MSRLMRFLPLIASLTVLSACDQPRAHGDANALIVAAPIELWEEVEEIFLDAMEPTIQAVRDERPFRITHHDPEDAEHWMNLQRFRQVLVLGDANDRWVGEALDQARDQEIGAPPTIVQVQNVWARGQLVSVLLLPEEGKVEAVGELAGSLQETLDRQYRDYAQTRMFVSGVNGELADSLALHEGFSFRFPQVYRHTSRDSVFRFRNDNPSPTELIREVVVTWISPIPEEDPSQADLEEWRVSFAEENYNDRQLLDTLVVSYRDVAVDGLSGVEYQSAWVSPPDAWPAGGPFITRAIRCPDQDRLYLMDAWLYAPGREKYEYMIQLQTILDSFQCH